MKTKKEILKTRNEELQRLKEELHGKSLGLIGLCGRELAGKGSIASFAEFENPVKDIYV